MVKRSGNISLHDGFELWLQAIVLASCDAQAAIRYRTGLNQAIGAGS